MTVEVGAITGHLNVWTLDGVHVLIGYVGSPDIYTAAGAIPDGCGLVDAVALLAADPGVAGFTAVASLEWDPTSAEVFSVGNQPRRKFENAGLSKSLRAAVQAIQSTLSSSRAAIDLAVGERSQP